MNAPKTDKEERLILDAIAWKDNPQRGFTSSVERALERAIKDVIAERAQPLDFGAVEIIRAHAGDVELLPGFDRVTGRRVAT